MTRDRARAPVLRPPARSPRPMKVFRFQGMRTQRDTEEIVAAPSMLAAMRAFGCTRTEFRNFGGDVGREDLRSLALSAPGVVFWRPFMSRDGVPWARVEPTKEV